MINTKDDDMMVIRLKQTVFRMLMGRKLRTDLMGMWINWVDLEEEEESDSNINFSGCDDLDEAKSSDSFEMLVE